VVLAFGALGARSQEGAKPGSDATPVQVLITPESLRWTGAPSLPPGAKVAVLEGDPRAAGPFTMRFQFPSDYRIPPHSHPADERATVLSGTLYLGTGDKADRSRARALPAGSYAVTRAGQPHFAFTREPTVVQVHGTGPWGVTFLDSEAAPREK
jgi:quercetin dioxygenase-like cupin family protein